MSIGYGAGVIVMLSYVQDITQGFFAILGRSPRAFQIENISMVNHYIGKIVIIVQY